ncbi:uncharacterized protein LOC142983083 [Anticarsia gemmatalis]|uniref:uncharacterized protein LOC142983083 n=1 Tax=Anticarsia gemmatalis TaxID=129554 RepID=UPI003F775462
MESEGQPKGMRITRYITAGPKKSHVFIVDIPIQSLGIQPGEVPCDLTARLKNTIMKANLKEEMIARVLKSTHGKDMPKKKRSYTMRMYVLSTPGSRARNNNCLYLN